MLILTTAILALRRWWQVILGIKTFLTIFPELGIDSRNTTVQSGGRTLVFSFLLIGDASSLTGKNNL